MNINTDWKAIHLNINNCNAIEDFDIETFIIDNYPQDIDISCQQDASWEYVNSKETYEITS